MRRACLFKAILMIFKRTPSKKFLGGRRGESPQTGPSGPLFLPSTVDPVTRLSSVALAGVLGRALAGPGVMVEAYITLQLRRPTWPTTPLAAELDIRH